MLIQKYIILIFHLKVPTDYLVINLLGCKSSIFKLQTFVFLHELLTSHILFGSKKTQKTGLMELW